MKVHNACTHEKTFVGRMRAGGNRIRRQCADCGHLGKWERVESTPVPKVVHTANGSTVQHTAVASKPDLSTFVVADLRDMAKREGITGYSKMKKGELVAALTAK